MAVDLSAGQRPDEDIVGHIYTCVFACAEKHSGVWDVGLWVFSDLDIDRTGLNSLLLNVEIFVEDVRSE